MKKHVYQWVQHMIQKLHNNKDADLTEKSTYLIINEDEHWLKASIDLYGS